MTSRRRHSFLYPLFYRTLTAVLIAVLGVGASWAPPAGGAGCGACVGQGAADAGCVERPADETAPGADSCCHGETDHGPARPGTGNDASHRHDDGGCPGRCAACCLPVGRTTALDVGFDAGLVLAPTTLELVATPASPHSSGVHDSVFHPPRA